MIFKFSQGLFQTTHFINNSCIDSILSKQDCSYIIRHIVCSIYHFNNSINRYGCGILIEDKYRGNGYSKEGLKLLCDYAKSQGIDYLYDDFEDNRPGTSIFYDLGFKEIDRYQSKRFDKYLDIVVVGIDLNEEDNNISTN